MARFDGQVALITGSAVGIGLAVATRLGSEGANIVMVDYDGAKAQQAAAALGEKGVDVLVEVGDVGEPAVAASAVRRAVERWGRVDVLVNNAGIAGRSANLWELSVEEMDQVYKTNLRGVFIFHREVIPQMLKRAYGRIVNIASIAGKEGNPKASPYSSTKAGVIGLTKSVGKELAKTGIRVNCVTPAVIQTDILKQVSKEHLDYMLSKIPMGRTGDVTEVAALVAWLASPECSFSTGAVFDISGGRATY
ncbi:MAG: SDR family oxidoreductase [SAR202 cluster bacterium]|nr:SDR family oxidoreductase [SAR202 cluster bacterium]